MAHWVTKTHRLAVAAMVTVAVLLPTRSAAQLNGQNIKGDAGLKSGSQPPPGAYVVVPLWFYTADAVKDQDGRELLKGSLDSAVFGGGLHRGHAEDPVRRPLRVHGRAAGRQQPRAGQRGLRLQSRAPG